MRRMCSHSDWKYSDLGSSRTDLANYAQAKDAAVQAEDYDEAKRLKASIDRLKVCVVG